MFAEYDCNTNSLPALPRINYLRPPARFPAPQFITSREAPVQAPCHRRLESSELGQVSEFPILSKGNEQRSQPRAKQRRTMPVFLNTGQARN